MVNLTPKTWRYACRLAGVLLILSAVALVVLAICRPVHLEPVPVVRTRQVHTRPTNRTNSELPTESQWIALSKKQLRRPLYDPAPTVTPPSAVPVLHVVLTGTMIDVNDKQAILQDRQGVTVMAREGKAVQLGAYHFTVLKIEPGKAVVQYAGRPVVLTLDREKD